MYRQSIHLTTTIGRKISVAKQDSYDFFRPWHSIPASKKMGCASVVRICPKTSEREREVWVTMGVARFRQANPVVVRGTSALPVLPLLSAASLRN